MRKLTIGYIPNSSEPIHCYPFLRLQGLWLEKLGWEIGTKVEVRASEEEIIIRKVNLEENTPESENAPEQKKEK